MRGNRGRADSEADRSGSIPAHAGKPYVMPGLYYLPWVYPRPCGETKLLRCRSHRGRGLSPPMRGNLDRIDGNEGDHGSIPAHAGKPWCRAPPPGSPRVYPRPCGETTSALGSTVLGWGLSPPMRGNHNWTVIVSGYTGSIPAHAGKPTRELVFGSGSGVYPRPCGETTVENTRDGTVGGLSPPMRGNLAGVTARGRA